jgi:hypothetical protein
MINLFKKSYVGILKKEDGQITTIVVSSWRWHNPIWFLDQMDKLISSGNIIDFKRIK